MRCYLCLSHSAGPLGMCGDCLQTVYPHGVSPWVASHVKTRVEAPMTEGVHSMVPVG